MFNDDFLNNEKRETDYTPSDENVPNENVMHNQHPTNDADLGTEEATPPTQESFRREESEQGMHNTEFHNERPQWGRPTENYSDNPYRAQQERANYNNRPPQPAEYNTSTGFQTPQGDLQNQEYKWNINDYQKETQRGKPKRNRGLVVFASLISIVFAISLLTFAGYGVYSMIMQGDANTEPTAPPSSSEQSVIDMPSITINDKPEVESTPSADGSLTSVEIAEKVSPSVVAIEAYSSAGFGATSQGSGIILSSDGTIITNAHVVEGSTGVKVVLDNGEAYAAELVGYDTQTDLAVLKIEEENLAYVELGNSDEMSVGEKVLAIGNSWGMQGTVTQGIISGIDRVVRSETGYDMSFMQVDAAINPGNSGGALVNEFGQVIGINTSKFVDAQVEGIGFAIPINEAVPIIEDIILNGRVTGRAKLGIEGSAIDAIDARMYGVPMGVQIINIQNDSGLIGTDVIPGDIITAVDNVEITSFEDLRASITGKVPGDLITLTLYRLNNNPMLGSTFEVTIPLVEE